MTRCVTLRLRPDVPTMQIKDVALDATAGKMYWTERTTGKIQRGNLDGTAAEDLVTAGLDDPWGFALDATAGKIY